jgi:hypothetical protein
VRLGGGGGHADNGVLLHEMIHQFLQERDEDPKHMGRALVAGDYAPDEGHHRDIWAGKSKTVRQGEKVVRMNAPRPVTGEPPLGQADIASWPHSIGIDLGRLGEMPYGP